MRIVEMDKNIYHKGSCCCGDVKYSLFDHPLFTHTCHCKDCKKSTGSAFVFHTMTLENTFLIDGDIEAASIPTGSGASYKPYFCKNCGTYFYCKYDMAPGRIIIRTSTLDDSENFPPQAHIFTRSKVPWITLDDKIPSFESMYDRNKLWPKASLDKLNSIR